MNPIKYYNHYKDLKDKLPTNYRVTYDTFHDKEKFLEACLILNTALKENDYITFVRFYNCVNNFMRIYYGSALTSIDTFLVRLVWFHMFLHGDYNTNTQEEVQKIIESDLRPKDLLLVKVFRHAEELYYEHKTISLKVDTGVWCIFALSIFGSVLALSLGWCAL